jgi:hypothetical protein
MHNMLQEITDESPSQLQWLTDEMILSQIGHPPDRIAFKMCDFQQETTGSAFTGVEELLPVETWPPKEQNTDHSYGSHELHACRPDPRCCTRLNSAFISETPECITAAAHATMAARMDQPPTHKPASRGESGEMSCSTAGSGACVTHASTNKGVAVWHSRSTAVSKLRGLASTRRTRAPRCGTGQRSFRKCGNA